MFMEKNIAHNNNLHNIIDINQIIKLRHKLHQNAELSGKEFVTKKIILDFLKKTKNAQLINIGNNSFAFIFKGKENGKTILFRADIDALPINENKSLEYFSKNKGISHKCGHDGHATILAALTKYFDSITIKKGKVILLFQSAEETGEGAIAVINDKIFNTIKPDYAFAIHNLPSYNKNSIIIKKETFSLASKGITIKLTGKTSHAAYPEQGINPSNAISEIIKLLNNIEKYTGFEKTIYITIINISMGNKAFGTSPGNAEISATLRTTHNTDMFFLCKTIEKETLIICNKYKIKVAFEYSEKFPACINNTEAVQYIKKTAEKLNIQTIELTQAFRWSEDFAHFSEISKSALFGIGAGKNHPELHNTNYDFPDDIIHTAINIFIGIIIHFNLTIKF